MIGQTNRRTNRDYNFIYIQITTRCLQSIKATNLNVNSSSVFQRRYIVDRQNDRRKNVKKDLIEYALRKGLQQGAYYRGKGIKPSTKKSIYDHICYTVNYKTQIYMTYILSSHELNQSQADLILHIDRQVMAFKPYPCQFSNKDLVFSSNIHKEPFFYITSVPQMPSCLIELRAIS